MTASYSTETFIWKQKLRQVKGRKSHAHGHSVHTHNCVGAGVVRVVPNGVQPPVCLCLQAVSGGSDHRACFLIHLFSLSVSLVLMFPPSTSHQRRVWSLTCEVPGEISAAVSSKTLNDLSFLAVEPALTLLEDSLGLGGPVEFLVQAQTLVSVPVHPPRLPPSNADRSEASFPPFGLLMLGWGWLVSRHRTKRSTWLRYSSSPLLTM